MAENGSTREAKSGGELVNREARIAVGLQLDGESAVSEFARREAGIEETGGVRAGEAGRREVAAVVVVMHELGQGVATWSSAGAFRTARRVTV